MFPFKPFTLLDISSWIFDNSVQYWLKKGLKIKANIKLEYAVRWKFKKSLIGNKVFVKYAIIRPFFHLPFVSL